MSQRASYFALHSSFFGPVARLIMIVLSLAASMGLLISSRCIPNDARTNHLLSQFQSLDMAHASKHIKHSVMCLQRIAKAASNYLVVNGREFDTW